MEEPGVRGGAAANPSGSGGDTGKGGISEQEEERRRVGGDLEGARAGEWRIL
jgi:hypothetical protein